MDPTALSWIPPFSHKSHHTEVPYSPTDPPTLTQVLLFFLLITPQPTATLATGVDELGVPVSWEASGWAARIIQHEMDHLDGILYIDRMDSRTFTNVGWMELLD